MQWAAGSTIALGIAIATLAVFYAAYGACEAIWDLVAHLLNRRTR